MRRMEMKAKRDEKIHSDDDNEQNDESMEEMEVEMTSARSTVGDDPQVVTV
jgi:hypothetical protein